MCFIASFFVFALFCFVLLLSYNKISSGHSSWGAGCGSVYLESLLRGLGSEILLSSGVPLSVEVGLRRR